MTQRSPCYSAVSALLTNPLPDHSNYSPLCHTHYLTPINTSLVSSGQTLYQAASWRLILQSSLLQRFTAESSREVSTVRKLNNKQRQVSMFLFKLLNQFPFLSISILSLLPFSILSLLPLPIPSFSCDQFFVFLRLKTSSFITFCFTTCFPPASYWCHNISFGCYFINLMNRCLISTQLS